MGRGVQKTQKTSLGEMTMEQRSKRWPGDLPDPGIGPMSLMSFVLAGGFLTTSVTWKAQMGLYMLLLP